MSADSELGVVARLLGRLLLREVDAELAAELRRSPLAEALGEVGIRPPDLDPAGLDELAARYFDQLVNPKDAPPLIQSLCQQGSYEGDAAVAVRAVADAAGVEYAREAARGAGRPEVPVMAWWRANARSAWSCLPRRA